MFCVEILQNLLTNKIRYATDPILDALTINKDALTINKDALTINKDALTINKDALAIKCGGNVEGKKSLTWGMESCILLDVRRGNGRDAPTAGRKPRKEKPNGYLQVHEPVRS